MNLKTIYIILISSKKFIIVATMIAALVGIGYSLILPVIFTTTARVLPEITQSSSSRLFSGFSSIAGLAGLDIDNMGNTDAIRPMLYPDIVSSTPFAVHLLNTPVETVDGAKYESLGHFMTRDRKLGVISTLVNSISDFFKSEEGGAKKESYSKIVLKEETEINKFTKIQTNLIKSVKSMVMSSIDKKSGVITLSVKQSDPKVTGILAHEALNFLKTYVVDYRLGKLKVYEKFLEDKTIEAKKRYENARYNLSSFRDRNKNMILLVPKTQEDELKYEYDLAFGLYLEVSKKLEQTKIQAQNETPVLKVLEPPVEPLTKSEPKRTIIVLTVTFLGFIMSIFYTLYKKIDWSTVEF